MTFVHKVRDLEPGEFSNDEGVFIPTEMLADIAQAVAKSLAKQGKDVWVLGINLSVVASCAVTPNAKGAEPARTARGEEQK